MRKSRYQSDRHFITIDPHNAGAAKLTACSMEWIRVRRREFIGGVGCVILLPAAALAQAAGKVWRIGYVGTGGLGDQLLHAFTQKLDALGYIQGKIKVSLSSRRQHDRGYV
jgi:hypothetical protein